MIISIWAQAFAERCCNLPGGDSDWVMASSLQKAKLEMIDLMKQRRPILEMCPCVSGPCAAVLEVIREVSRDAVGVFVEVFFPEVENGVDFDSLQVPQWTCECGCQKVKTYLLHMPLWVWNQYFKNKLPMTVSFVGLMHVDWKTPKYLNLSQPLGYFLLPKERKSWSPSSVLIRYAEMFTGGFSGWSQAANILAEFCWEFEFMWGIELDADAAKMFKLSFKDVYVAQTFGQAVEQYVVDSGNDSSSPFLFQCDVGEGWWMQFVQTAMLDLLVMSPPCQPWSFPNAQSPTTGLLSSDGLIMIEALVKSFEMSTGIVALESVATLPEHPHWKVVLMVVEAYGYKLVWSAVLDLAEMIPQHRRRFLALIMHPHVVENNAALDTPICCESWPKLQKPTIGSYGVLAPLDGLWAPMVALSDFERLLFLDPNLLPMARGAKRSRIDVIDYRMKSPADVFPCIMASYTQQVHFDIDILRNKGLYGGLVKCTDEPLTFRYLSAPEGLILMGLVQNLVIPADKKLHWRLIGNAISTPHAIITMWNAARVLSGIEVATPSATAVMERLLQSVYRNRNITWRTCPDGIVIEQAGSVELTQTFTPVAVPQFSKLSFVCGKWRCMVYHQHEIHPKEVLKLLNSGFNEGYDLSKLPHATTWADEVLQQVMVPFDLDLSHLQAEDFDSPCVIMLTRLGIFVVVRQPHAVDNGIGFMALNDSIGTAPGHTCPTNAVGLAVAFNDPLPQITIVNDGHPLPGSYRRCISLLDFAPVGDFAEKFVCYVDLDDAIEIYQFFLRTKLEAAIISVGWSLSVALKESWLRHSTGAGPAHIMLQPEKAAMALGTHAFRVFMSMRIAYWLSPTPVSVTTEMAQQKVDDTEIPAYMMVKVKYQDDTVWRGMVPATLQVGAWAKSVEEGASKFHDHVPVRTIIHGRRQDHGQLIMDFWKPDQLEIKVFLVCALHGGGNKEGMQVMAKNKLATHLLQQGSKLDEVTTFVNKVVHTIGFTRVLQAFDSDNPQKIAVALQEIAKQCGVQVPGVTVKEATQAKVNAAVKRKGLHLQSTLTSSLFTLAEGFFNNEDGSPAQILPVFSTTESGVTLMDYKDSQEWVGSTKLTADELAIVVLGTAHSFQEVVGQKISFPAIDQQGNSVVLNGVLYQLGEKLIKVNTSNRTMIKGTDSVVVSFSMHADEFNAQMWTSIVAAPVRYAQNQWAKDGLKDVMLSAPWNRTWKNSKNIAVAPNLSEVVTFFARVPKDNIERLLKTSGENHIYAFPRADPDQPPDWLAVWIPQAARAEVIKMAARSVYFRGLIRSSKAFGVRVCKADFVAAWKEFRPDAPVPDRRHMPFLAKVKPFPHGTTHDDIVGWLNTIKMEARPLKSLGPDAWLIAMVHKPKVDFADYNGNVVLFKVLDKNKPQSAVVLAGAVPQPSGQAQGNDDPWKDWNDPWSDRSGGGSRPRTNTSSTVSRVIDPPIASRFQQYEDQLDALKTSITTIKEDLQASKTTQKQDIAMVNGRLDNMDANLNSGLQTLANTFEQSLATALSNQDRQMRSGFDDLKNLLEATSKIPSPARVRQKTTHEDGMQEDTAL